MKTACLCIRVHTPLILSNYRFFEIGAHHRYYDDSKLAEQINQQSKKIWLPFFKMLQRLNAETHGAFKAGIAIPGITLKLFQEAAPEIIVLFRELLQNHCIEFLSEPWGHSLLPFFNTWLFSAEVKRHDKLIGELFGTAPEILYMYAPTCYLPLRAVAEAKQKKGIFTYINSLSNDEMQENVASCELPDEFPVMLIDPKISQLFGKIDFDPAFHALASYASGIADSMNRRILPNRPSIIVFNPAQKNKPFTTDQALAWETVVKQMLNIHQIQYAYPSQMFEQYCPSVFDADFFDQWLQHYRLPDFWLHTKMQRKVLAKQKAINALTLQLPDSQMCRQWDVVQDMDNLFFISKYFFKVSFAASHFSPYQSPYLAYINYMNILEDLHVNLKAELRNFGRRTRTRRKQKHFIPD